MVKLGDESTARSIENVLSSAPIWLQGQNEMEYLDEARKSYQMQAIHQFAIIIEACLK